MDTFEIDARPVKSYGTEEVGGPDLRVFRRVAMTMKGDAIPFVVKMTASLQNGRMAVEALTLEQVPGGPAVTGEALRSLRVAAMLRTAAWEAAVMDESASALMQREPAAITRDGKTDDALAAVSLAYRMAYVAGDAPRKKVMETLGLPRATASRWIDAAVERGFLDAELANRIGEEG